jgi:hypothetical protein
MEEETPTTKFQAIYFIMGHYNEDDNVDPKLNGFDCPFCDSPVLYADTEDELARKVMQIYDGKVSVEGDWETCYPDVICDMQGNLLNDVYQKIVGEPFDPDEIEYSFGRETVTQFWKREKWRWFPHSKQ